MRENHLQVTQYHRGVPSAVRSTRRRSSSAAEEQARGTWGSISIDPIDRPGTPGLSRLRREHTRVYLLSSCRRGGGRGRPCAVVDRATRRTAEFSHFRGSRCRFTVRDGRGRGVYPTERERTVITIPLATLGRVGQACSRPLILAVCCVRCRRWFAQLVSLTPGYDPET